MPLYIQETFGWSTKPMSGVVCSTRIGLERRQTQPSVGRGRILDQIALAGSVALREPIVTRLLHSESSPPVCLLGSIRK